MTAGTHAVNAALHRAGVTRDDDAYPTQPGVYLVPQADGSLRPQFRPLGDVLHVGRPKVEVLAGINLPMLVKLAKVRDECPLADAVAAAQDSGRKYITIASRVLSGK